MPWRVEPLMLPGELIVCFYFIIMFPISSYNCRGLKLGQSEANRCQRFVTDKLFARSDIVCLEETWLTKQDLCELNSLNPCFHGTGEVKVNCDNGPIQGCISGGVAILWKTQYDGAVSDLSLGLNWAVDIQMCFGDKMYVIINVYTPYECYENEGEYLNNLATIALVAEELETTCVYIIGDFNADISDDRSLLSSEKLLPEDSFTYISEAWHTVSWLDHTLTSAYAHTAIEKLRICYDLATTDHIPFEVCLKLDSLPGLTNANK